jgi:hypothetical protein
MNITPEYINSFKAVGMNNIPHDELVSLKQLVLLLNILRDGITWVLKISVLKNLLE